MTNIVPFDSASLPAHLQGLEGLNSDLTSHVGNGGYPVLSIKGKVFTLVKNDDRTVITRPDDPDEAASSLELVILRANPNLSKVYYEAAFEEGSTAKPDCYSNDGIRPGSDVEEPQCKTCAACPHNVWGTGKEGKGKACSDSRRIAVASPSQINEPMLLRIPPATLKPLAEYGKTLANRGVPYTAVVTKVRFEREVSTPQLTFTPVGFLESEQFAEAQAVAASEEVTNIIGLTVKPADRELEAAMSPAKVEKAEAPAKVEKTAKAEAPAKVEKAAKAEKAEAPAKVEKAAKAEVPAKAKTAASLDELLGQLDD